MNLLQQFINFLVNQKNTPSLSTFKNYKADVGQFISWFEKEFSSAFDPLKINLHILEQYKKARNLSPSSIKRHISSLRKFFFFLKQASIINFDLFPIENNKDKIEADPWMIKNFKSYLYEHKKSYLTIKNYINDIKSFFSWLTEASLIKHAWDMGEKNLLEKLDFSVVEEYKQRLITAKFSPRTINRKLSSLRNYINWAQSQGLIASSHAELYNYHPEFTPPREGKSSWRISGSEMLKQVQHDTKENAYSSFPPQRLMQKSINGVNFLFDELFISPLAKIIENTQYLFWKLSGRNVFKKNVILIRQLAEKNLGSFGFQPQDDIASISNIQKEFYAPLEMSTHYLSVRKKIFHYLHYVRPKWYKKYHSYSITRYFHLAILILAMSTAGFISYNRFFSIPKEKSVLGTLTSNTRSIKFKGRLADTLNNPITLANTSLRMAIYNGLRATDSALMWQEVTIVNPDSDGAFQTTLGDVNPIPNSIFTDNPSLFLGISIGKSQELTPRQEIPSVSYAYNAQTLQGLKPITDPNSKEINAILALDSSGNLSIMGTRNHTFQTINSQFVLSGQVLSLTTVSGHNGNVEIAPDGMGKIDLLKPIQNSANSNNLLGVSGAVEFDDSVAILATTSGQSAFTVNQNATGDLISASTSGIAKFSVDSEGTGIYAGDVGINGGNLTSTKKTFNLLNSDVATLNIGGGSGIINLGLLNGIINIKSHLNIAHDLSLSSLTSKGGILYTNETGKIFQVSAGSNSDCLTGGSTPAFSPCNKNEIFNQTEGSVYLSNSTMDFLLGGPSTSSAKIAFVNMASGTPTASISGDITLNSAGIIRTTNFQNLTLGGSTTGGIALSAGSSIPSLYAANGGFVGIGTTNPSAKFDVSADCTNFQSSHQCTDYAELYPSSEPVEPGDVLTIDTINSPNMIVKKSNVRYQSQIIGIVSTNPAVVVEGNSVQLMSGASYSSNPNKPAVALAGRVPVKVSTENGPINIGDPLTSSSIPGVAMKATKAGVIIGKALRAYNDTDKNHIGKIFTFVNTSWSDPDAYLTDTGDYIITNSSAPSEIEYGPFVLKSPLGDTIYRVGAFAQIASANIRAGIINASEVITNSLVITSDSIIVNGQNLKDYIVSAVNESGIMNQESSIISPVVKTDQLFTNIISPLAKDSNISVSLHDSQFIIHNSNDASGSAVAKIDNQGNASFSGQLQANELLTNQLTASDASISGTLRARSIIAESIDLPAEAMLAALQAGGFIDIASFSANLAYVPNLQAEQGLFNQGLMVFGATSLSDLSVAGQLSINGTMFLADNSIDTLGTDLSLQSLRQGGLSIMGGLMHIDTDGNLKIQGDVSIKGKLAINIISPLPDSDLVVNNASGSAVLSVNQTGDLIASGSGTFSKLNLSLVQPALAISQTEVIATGSAGVTSIKPYQTEITIKNHIVTDKSLIYITPVGTPSAQSPFLLRQTDAESFTVGIQNPILKETSFNWLIVN